MLVFILEPSHILLRLLSAVFDIEVDLCKYMFGVRSYVRVPECTVVVEICATYYCFISAHLYVVFA